MYVFAFDNKGLQKDDRLSIRKKKGYSRRAISGLSFLSRADDTWIREFGSNLPQSRMHIWQNAFFRHALRLRDSF